MGNENGIYEWKGGIYEWKGMRRIYAMGAVLVFVEGAKSVYFNYWEMEVKDRRLHVVFPFHVDFFLRRAMLIWAINASQRGDQFPCDIIKTSLIKLPHTGSLFL